MNSIVGKKRVSFDISFYDIIKVIPKIDVKELPIRVRSDNNNELHVQKYIGLYKYQKLKL
jgi:hypothetical protein